MMHLKWDLINRSKHERQHSRVNPLGPTSKAISMAYWKAAVTPLLTHWNCCSLALSHQFQQQFLIWISNPMERSFCSYPNYFQVIQTKFYTKYDNCTIMACAKVCENLVASNAITTIRLSHKIWISIKIVKWNWALEPLQIDIAPK